MEFSDFKVGQKVKVYRKANPENGGPKPGDEGYIEEIESDNEDGYYAVLVALKDYGPWYFMDCKHDKGHHHHHRNECWCMLERPYSWRKL